VFILDGKPLALDRAFTHAGVQYPANWLRLASPAERSAIGITEVPGPQPYDERFYWGWTTSGTLIPKDHDQLVTLWSDQTNTTANTLLSPTDWMVVREVDNGKVMPSGVKEWRQEVRYACEDKISVLTLTKTTDELANYVTYTSPSGGATTDYNYWPQLNSTPVPSGSYSSSVAGATILGGDDTLSFSSNSTSASIGSL
jgi:hypothetical protein